ncbi:MAG: entry exclusion protein TrbK [Alphaproteobacteria bacterium]|nr:entry exclusion protein TrbK [Alphaproteobacteria bacterium]
MSRAILIAAVLVVIGIVLVVQLNRTTPDSAPTAGDTAPSNYDTTGGQQMQPRWNR